MMCEDVCILFSGGFGPPVGQSDSIHSAAPRLEREKREREILSTVPGPIKREARGREGGKKRAVGANEKGSEHKRRKGRRRNDGEIPPPPPPFVSLKSEILRSHEYIWILLISEMEGEEERNIVNGRPGRSPLPTLHRRFHLFSDTASRDSNGRKNERKGTVDFAKRKPVSIRSRALAASDSHFMLCNENNLNSDRGDRGNAASAASQQASQSVSHPI